MSDSQQDWQYRGIDNLLKDGKLEKQFLFSALVEDVDLDIDYRNESDVANQKLLIE